MVKPLEKSLAGIGKSFLPGSNLELGPKDLNEQGKDCYKKNVHLIPGDFKISYNKIIIYDTILFFDPKAKKVHIIKHRGLPAYSDLIKFPDIWNDPRYTINE